MPLFRRHPRFVKLNGDAVHKPLWRSFHESSGLKTTGLFMAFNLAATACTNHFSLEQGAIILGAALAGYAAGEMSARTFSYIFLFETFKFKARTKCVDRAPDRSTVPTSPQDMTHARAYLTHYTMLGALCTGVLTAAGLGMDVTPAKQLADDVIGAILNPTLHTTTKLVSSYGFATFWLRYTHNGYRFYKVLKGDWAIVDPPKPAPKKERAPVLAPQPAM